jgi:hypothetical protein
MAQLKFIGLEFWAKLDEVGEEQVRTNFIKNVYGDHGVKRELVLEWLLIKNETRALEASTKPNALEEENLSIERFASTKVRNYRIITIVAIIIVVIVADDEIMWLISSLMSWFSK